jgi:hypothetical protein
MSQYDITAKSVHINTAHRHFYQNRWLNAPPFLDNKKDAYYKSTVKQHEKKALIP